MHFFSNADALVARDVRNVTPRWWGADVSAYYHARWKQRLYILTADVSAYNHARRNKDFIFKELMLMHIIMRT